MAVRPLAAVAAFMPEKPAPTEAKSAEEEGDGRLEVVEHIKKGTNGQTEDGEHAVFCEQNAMAPFRIRP